MLIGGSVLFFLTRAWIFPTNLELPAWIIIAVIVIIGTAVGFSVAEKYPLQYNKFKGEIRITYYKIFLSSGTSVSGRQRCRYRSATSAGKENGELFTEEVIKNIIEEFSLSDEEAEKYMKMYW